MLKSLIDESEISKKVYLVAFLVISLASFLSFSNVISGDFVADDIFYVVENESIKSLFNPDIFFSKEHLTRNFVNFNNYRPIYFFALSIEYALFGLDPRGYHLVNIFLHIVNSFLLYSLTIKYTNKKILALLTTLIFVVHPIHTEAVSNITGLSEVLTAFFLLLATWSYSKSKSLDFYYLSSLTCYLLAIMSKESGVVLLGVIILLDICSNSFNINELKRKSVYYLGYLFTFLAYLAFKLSIRGAILNSKTSVFAEGQVRERLYTMSLAFIEYFRLLVWPSKLIAFYDIFIIPIVKEPTIFVVGALCLIFGLLITGIVLLKYEKGLAFSILFFFGTISVVSNIFFDVGVIMAERFLYFPSISICLITALGFYFLINKENNLKFIAIGLFILVFFSLIIRTYIRNLDWLTQESVRVAFLRDAPESPRVAVMQYDKVIELFNLGQVQAAIDLAKEVVKKNPNYALVHYKLGTMLESQGNQQEALISFARAKELRPNNLEMRNAYAMSLLNNGAFLEAKAELESIIQEDPKIAEPHNYLGVIYINLELYSQAEKEFEKALAINPNYKAAEFNLFKLKEIMQKKPK